jgi:hypothetical protein
MLLLAFFPVVLHGGLYVFGTLGREAVVNHEFFGLVVHAGTDSNGVG